MKNCKKFFIAFLLLTISLTYSTAAKKQKAVLTKNPERMFWTISGTDSKGNPSYVHILGTIHVGDEKLYPLEENVLAAWNRADHLVAEVALVDIKDNLMPKVMEAMYKSVLPNGQSILNDLSDEETSMLIETMGEKLTSVYSKFQPWISTLMCQSVYISSLGFETGYGLDNNLYALAAQSERDVEGLDSLQTQMDIITFGDYDTQISLLKGLLDELIAKKTIKEHLDKLYDAYLKNDAEALAKLSEKTISDDKEKNSIYEKYYNKLYIERNEAWAKKIAKYLKAGGETFIFAGAAHFTVDKTVFYYLEKQGVL